MSILKRLIKQNKESYEVLANQVNPCQNRVDTAESMFEILPKYVDVEESRAERLRAWKSVLGMCELFRSVAQFVGEKLGWRYNEKEGKAARDFLEYVHQLPKNR